LRPADHAERVVYVLEEAHCQLLDGRGCEVLLHEGVAQFIEDASVLDLLGERDLFVRAEQLVAGDLVEIQLDGVGRLAHRLLGLGPHRRDRVGAGAIGLFAGANRGYQLTLFSLYHRSSYIYTRSYSVHRFVPKRRALALRRRPEGATSSHSSSS